LSNYIDPNNQKNNFSQSQILNNHQPLNYYENQGRNDQMISGEFGGLNGPGAINLVDSSDESKKYDQLSNERKYINNHLEAYGYSQVGDITPYNIQAIESIHKTIQALLQQRQYDLEYRKESFEKIRNL
jgi:hypothetical protein